jgi:uncharacterized lipoprotein YmbA
VIARSCRHGLCALALASACASGPEHFYALSAGPQPAAESGGRAPSVVVETAVLPDLIDRPQLVVRGPGSTVSILEQQRWAEPLRTGIPRVVAENLTKLLGTTQISTRDDVIRSPDCRVMIDVRRLDAQTEAEVVLEALWTVGCGEAGRRSGQSVAHEKLLSRDIDAVVTAHGRVLDSMSRDIAHALHEAAAASASAAAPAR